MDRILALQNLASFTFDDSDNPATKSTDSNGCSTVSSQALISSCSNVCPPGEGDGAAW